MHKDYVHEMPLFIKMVPLNIEVVYTLISFEQWFSMGKSKLKTERALLEKRQMVEFDFISKLVEMMTGIVSKEEGKKKGLQMFEFARLKDLLYCLLKALQVPLEHVKTMREVRIWVQMYSCIQQHVHSSICF
jgi:hypothetical protein